MFGVLNPEFLKMGTKASHKGRYKMKGKIAISGFIKIPVLFLLISFLLNQNILAEETDISIKTDSITYSLGARSVLGTGKFAPFLTSANQYDRHSIYSNNLSVWGNIHKDLNFNKFFDYGFGAEIDGNISSKENRIFPGEFYAEAKAWLLIFTAGMKRENFSNSDALLSSGGLLYSRNSRPMPLLTCKSVGWVKVPFTFGLLECMGGMSHGWFTDSTITRNTLLHYKYGGLRLGGKFPIKLSFVLNHAAQWGGTNPYYGTSPATIDNFIRIFLAKSGGADAPATERYNVLGNHIVSKYYGIQYDSKNFNVEFYWQNIFEDTPIRPLGMAYNVEDGLWGISFKMPKFKPLQRVALEFLSTTDMSGPWHDLDGVIYGGMDGYYNNGVYPNGWSFYGMTIGNPWLTSPKYNEGGAIGIQNNMVRLYYLSGLGSIKDINYRATIAYSQNFGNPGWNHDSKDQLSWQLETEKNIGRNLTLIIGFSGDNAKMYGNNFALLAGICWNGAFKYYSDEY
jgi:hypothetical protein